MNGATLTDKEIEQFLKDYVVRAWVQADQDQRPFFEVLRSLLSTALGKNVEFDPLYPHVRIFYLGEETDISLTYVIKERATSDTAKHEAEALKKWGENNGITFGHPDFKLPIVQQGTLLFTPYIGPEVYTVTHSLSQSLDKLAEEGLDSHAEEISDLCTFRRALVLTQVDTLVTSLVNPYIPKHDDGSPIESTPDEVIANYIDNISSVISSTRGFQKEEQSESLHAALSVFQEILNPNELQRYIDTYARNIGFRVPRIRRGQLVHASLDDILALRKDFHRENGERLSSSFALDSAFLQQHLIQFDLHRCEKNALSGECLANIIHNPRLLAAEPIKFDEQEQINAFARYLFALAYYNEVKRFTTHDRDKAQALNEEINRTNEGTYTLDALRNQNLIPFDTPQYAHYLAMSFYKAIRWLGYIRDNYIPTYRKLGRQEGQSEKLREVAEYREKLSRSDLIIYRQTARRSLCALMDILYGQLPENKKSEHVKSIILNGVKDPDHRIPYHVMRERDNDNCHFTFGVGKNQRPIAGDSIFLKHISQFSRRAATQSEKIYSKLLRLGYIATILP